MNECTPVLTPEKEKIRFDCILAAMYFFIMPLSIVRVFGMSVLKLISFPLGAYFLFTLFIGEKKLKANLSHLIVSLYIVYTISSLFLLRYDNAWVNVRGMLETFFVFMLITTRIYNQKEKNFLIYIWIAAGVLSTIMGYFSNADYGEGRTSLIIWGGTEDPNQFCGYFILPMMMYLQKIIRKNKMRVKLLYVTILFSSYLCCGKNRFSWRAYRDSYFGFLLCVGCG